MRSWWQQIKQNWLAILIVAILLVVVIALIIIEIIVNGTGFKGKTLWDWLQLLIIPLVLAIGGYLFTYTMSRNERKATDRHNQTEREIAQDNQREAALQEYINKIAELLLHEKLSESELEDKARKIARVRTLTVLSRLDSARKASVLEFLYESDLINKDRLVVDLRSADLSDAHLRYIHLEEADLRATVLLRADLRKANLRKANLAFSYLRESNMIETDLSGANLQGAVLREATITQEQLDKAKTLTGAIMPDGSIHP